MGIFSKIKDAIWASPANAAPVGLDPAVAETLKNIAAGSASSTATPASAPAPTPASAPSSGPVDIAAVLDAAVKAKKVKLNWRTSIVDLMKALDINSDLANRKELAQELGYTGDTSKSAEMNIWLHKAVIQKLKDNGGKVPADLLD